MLTELRLENYRCFKTARIKLSPLTVLVGPNSSGKSSLLSALRPLQPPAYRIEDVWQHERKARWKVEQVFSQGRPASLVLEHQKGLVADSLRSFQYQPLHLDINLLRRMNVLQEEHHLASEGNNLSNVFATLTRKRQEAIANRLGELVPSFRDVVVRPVAQGQHDLRFQDRWNESVWYRPAEVSDGTMLVTAYLVLQHETPPVDLIAIEEPERGLHPYLLGEMVSLWRKMTQGQIGPSAVQVILATHSAELLDHVEPSEVRFLSRNPESGEVRIEEVDAETDDWRKAYKTYQDSLGSMWLSGGLGGVPGQ